MSGEAELHEGKYKSAGYMLDSWECSCGWQSRPYFDGDHWAEAEWKKHVADSLASVLTTPKQEALE